MELEGRAALMTRACGLVLAATILATWFPPAAGASEGQGKGLKLFQQGEALRQEGKNREAVAAYLRAIEADPRFVKAHVRYQELMRLMGNLDQVTQEYRGKLRTNPEEALYYYLYGCLLMNLEDAEASFRKAIELSPSFFWGHFGLASTLMLQRRYEECLKEWKEAVALDPKNAEARYNLGLAYLYNGGKKTHGGVATVYDEMTKKAVAEWLKAIELDPQLVHPYVNLGHYYARGGNYDKAVEWYGKALKVNPASGRAHNNIAVAHYRREEYRLAALHLEKAKRLGYEVQPKFERAVNRKLDELRRK